jgi:hypothetical protein
MKKLVNYNGLLMRTFILSALISLIGLTACEDDQVADVSSETVLEETAFAENVFSNITYLLEEATGISSLSHGRFIGGFGPKGCATCIVDEPEEGGYPKVITLDYGEGCESRGGMIIQGKIVTTITSPRDEAGASISTTFEDFYVNDHHIEGTYTHTFVSAYVHTATLEGGKITTPEGETFTRESTHTHEMISGMDTEEYSDDVFQITGASNGVTPEGVSYSKTITNPLISSKDCPWITSGTIETVIDEVTSVIDFGEGECDNVATVTEDGETEEITMDFRIKRRVKMHRG